MTRADALEPAPRTALLRRQQLGDFDDKIRQLGSYGGGNHFGECEVVSHRRQRFRPRNRRQLSACATAASRFSPTAARAASATTWPRASSAPCRNISPTWSIPLPGNDRELVYAPLGTAEADAYLDDMALGANFATVNHMLINALVLEAFQEILPGTTGTLVYFISHNIARQEMVDNDLAWVHRKGATRAFPAGPPRTEGHAVRIDRPSDPSAGKSARRLGGDGRRRRRGQELLQRQPRRRPPHGPQGRDPPTGSGDDRSRNWISAIS